MCLNKTIQTILWSYKQNMILAVRCEKTLRYPIIRRLIVPMQVQLYCQLDDILALPRLLLRRDVQKINNRNTSTRTNEK